MSERTPWWQPLDAALGADDIDAIELLGVIGRYQRWLAALEKKAVGHARRSGSTWGDIGEALGTTRQSAWGRFAQQAVESAVATPESWVLAPGRDL